MDALKEYIYRMPALEFWESLWPIARDSPAFSAVCSGSRDPETLARLKEQFISAGVPAEFLGRTEDIERLSQLVATRYLATNAHLRP